MLVYLENKVRSPMHLQALCALTVYRPGGSENTVDSDGRAANSTCLEIEQYRHYLMVLLDKLTAMLLFSNLALNVIRVSFGIDQSLQWIEVLAVKLQQLETRPPAVIHQAAV